MVYDPTTEFNVRTHNKLTAAQVAAAAEAARSMVDDEAAEHIDKVAPSTSTDYHADRIRDFKAQANQHRDRMRRGFDEAHKVRANMALYDALKAEAQEAGVW